MRNMERCAENGNTCGAELPFFSEILSKKNLICIAGNLQMRRDMKWKSLLVSAGGCFSIYSLRR
jgi:hypothetical protein